MKRPSFQFYPGDWTSNSKLKRCTFSERGIWISVICLFHDSDEYGLLRWPLSDISLAIGCKIGELKSLEKKGILKGSDDNVAPFIFTPRHANKDGNPVTLIPEQQGPVWFCSRMVRDEYVRSKRGESSRFEAPKPQPKVGIGDGIGVSPIGEPNPCLGDGPSSSSSSSSLNSKAIAPSKLDAASLVSLGVDEQIAKDWLAVRKTKRAPLTATVIQSMQREAEKAGISFPEAVEICAKRSWQGFNASWNWKDAPIAVVSNGSAW